MIAKGYKFYIGLYSEILRIFLLLKIRTMATNFSPCKGSYVLNQFPSNVMFGMNGFHVSASGAIQGHHGPLVYLIHPCVDHLWIGFVIFHKFKMVSSFLVSVLKLQSFGFANSK